MIFAMPPLTVATALLALDRYLGFHFFTNDLGGNMMNYANLFWLFGHPEVYILILPAFGVYSEVVSTFSSKELYGYTSLVLATMAIAVLSFTVWVHHFFTMGQSANINAVFGIATMTIGVPTGVKIYDWIWTMFRGEVRFTVPMLYSLAFMMTFVLGGFTGIILAFPPLDYLVHNTLFLVAHFHNMLIPGLLYGMLAGYHYWFPKAFGFRLEREVGPGRLRLLGGRLLSRLHAALCARRGRAWRGARRRCSSPRSGRGSTSPASARWCCSRALASLFVQLWVSIRERDANRVFAGDPWDGRGLEWSTSAPPPEYNFAVIPHVDGRDPFYDGKRDGDPYAPPRRYEDIEMPKNSVTGPGDRRRRRGDRRSGWSGTCGGWRSSALLAIVAAVIARSFARDVHRIIPAAEVARTERRWLRGGRRRPSDPAPDRDDARQSRASPRCRHERDEVQPRRPQSRRDRRGDARAGRERAVRLLGVPDERRGDLRAAVRDLWRDAAGDGRRPDAGGRVQDRPRLRRDADPADQQLHLRHGLDRDEARVGARACCSAGWA